MNSEKTEEVSPEPTSEKEKILGLTTINFYLVVILISLTIFLAFQSYTHRVNPIDQSTLNNLPPMDNQQPDLGVEIFTIPYYGDLGNISHFDGVDLIPFSKTKSLGSYGEVCNGYIPTGQPARKVIMDTIVTNGSEYFCTQTTFEYAYLKFMNTTYNISFTEEECEKSTITSNNSSYLNLSYIKQICVELPFKEEPRFEAKENL